MSGWDSEHSRVRDEAADDQAETINLVPDHVHNMRLGVMLAARGVTNEGLEGILKEAEKVGRLADAMCALLGSLAEHQGSANTCEALLRDTSECCYSKGAGIGEGVIQQRRALRAGLIQAAAVFAKSD